MTTFRVEPDDDGCTALWRERPNGALEAVATLVEGQTRAEEGHWPDHGVVFRAAAAVLAPSDAVVLTMAKEMQAAAGGFAWNVLETWARDAWVGSAYAALRALRAHVEEATP